MKKWVACFNTPKGGRPSDTKATMKTYNYKDLVSIPRRVEGLPIQGVEMFVESIKNPEFQYPEGWKAFRYKDPPDLKESLAQKFQYPEGWKAFRY